jgi:hypothetical protein
MNLLSRFSHSIACRTVAKLASLALIAFWAGKLQGTAYAAGDSVPVGGSVTLLATADGSPAPTFQWRKNGTNISGATGQTYTITSATLADAGTYTVVATNTLGSATSAGEVITVHEVVLNKAPVITTQPTAAQSVTAGGTATFTVAATGTPTPAYQWLKNGVIIAGATGTTLTLPSVTTNDNASYAAIVTNVAGSATSNAGVLTVVAEPVVTPPPPPPPPAPTTEAPVITAQPAATQSVVAGGAVSFSVTASGTPTPAYQWRKNDVPIAGATLATLSLSSLTGSDAGTYSVVVSNSAGSATSNAAVLVVTEPVVVAPPPPPPPAPTNEAPRITSQPSSTQTILAGSSATLSISATGSPAPTFQWRKNGANIAGATSATFNLRAVTSADAATYSVIATNAFGTVVSDNATIVVNVAPVITTQPVPQAVASGASVKFTAVVSAIPGATFQWRKNGVAIPGATSAVLSIQSASEADAGSYSVVATNAVGTASSHNAALIIAAPPVIVKQPSSVSASAKSKVTLSVSASGSPAPTYQWKKDGHVIPGATESSLVLAAVSNGDTGVYTVQAANLAGWVVSAKATLAVSAQAGGGSGNDNGGGSGGAPDTGGSPTTSRLVNLSVRATAGTGSNSLIVGFVVDGGTTKPLLIRGIGPTLGTFGVAGALRDPSLALYTGSALTASNDDWMTNDNAAAIAGTSSDVGAFALPNQASDAALMATLNAGAYTAQLTSKDASSGVALVEVYDAASKNAAKLVNLSVRSQIGGTAEAPNVGFVIAGPTAKRVLIRAVGPTLGVFGVTDAIADPQVEIYRGGTKIEQNDNWGGSEALSAIFSQVGAFGLSDPNSRDAVLYTVLQPGAYTVVVNGTNGSNGVGLVELYEVP